MAMKDVLSAQPLIMNLKVNYVCDRSQPQQPVPTPQQPVPMPQPDFDNMIVDFDEDFVKVSVLL
jgi:hypothetical protein